MYYLCSIWKRPYDPSAYKGGPVRAKNQDLTPMIFLSACLCKFCLPLTWFRVDKLFCCRDGTQLWPLSSLVPFQACHVLLLVGLDVGGIGKKFFVWLLLLWFWRRNRIIIFYSHKPKTCFLGWNREGDEGGSSIRQYDPPSWPPLPQPLLFWLWNWYQFVCERNGNSISMPKSKQ